jgi:putative ABC transport system permease protein
VITQFVVSTVLLFPLASSSALVVAWLTVSYESLKAAAMNPAKSLRSE